VHEVLSALQPYDSPHSMILHIIFIKFEINKSLLCITFYMQNVTLRHLATEYMYL